MPTSQDDAGDMPPDAFIKVMAEGGFQWVKRIGHESAHIFQHAVTHEVMPVPVEREVVRAVYVVHARKRSRELGGGP